MKKIDIPCWVKRNDVECTDYREFPFALVSEVRKMLTRFSAAQPLVTIIASSTRKTDNLLSMLSSLADLELPAPCELIFTCTHTHKDIYKVLQMVNARVICLPAGTTEAQARQTALEMAKGEYILNADVNTIYPSKWIASFADSLSGKGVSAVSGKVTCFSRLHFYGVLGGIENLLQQVQHPGWASHGKCVPSFNFAFKKSEAMQLGGFDTENTDKPAARLCNELQKFGEVKNLISEESHVWHRMINEQVKAVR